MRFSLSVQKKNISSHVTTALWVLSLIIIARVLVRPLSDPDIWWHLASGRYMVEHRMLLNFEVFSFALSGMEWINFEWLTEILYFIIVDLFGFKGLSAFCHFLFAVSLAMLFLCLHQKKPHRIAELCFFWVGFELLQFRFDARVGLITLIFLPLFVYLVRKMDGLRKETRKYIPGLFFLLTVLWVNLHAGVLYGVGLLFAVAVGARWARKDKSLIQTIDRSFVWALVALLMNPYGPKYFEMVIEVLFNRGISQEFLGEWTPPSVRLFPAYWGLFLTSVVVMGVGLFKKSNSVRFWTPSLFIFLIWSSGQARATPLLAFVILPLLADLTSSRLGVPARQGIGRALLILPILLCAVFITKYAGKLLDPFPKKWINWKNFPVQACSFIETIDLKGRVFTTLRYGDYSTWALGPDRKTFLYGIYLFLPMIKESESLLNKNIIIPSEFQRFIQKYDFDYTLTPYSNTTFTINKSNQAVPFSLLEVLFQKKDWALIYFDDVSVIFLKRKEKHAPFIDRHEYKTLWPVNLEAMKHRMGKNLINENDYRKELERHRSVTENTRIGKILSDLLITRTPYLWKKHL